MDQIKPSQESTSVSSAQPMVEPEIKIMPEKYIGASLRGQPKLEERVVVVEKVKVVEKIVPAAPPPKQRKRGLPKWPIAALLAVLLVGGGAFYYVSTLNVPLSAPVLNTAPPPPPPAPPVVPALEPTPSPPAPAEIGPKKGADADSDGLTDAEEAMYGSNKANPDSDDDGFLDGVEVFHLYNPAGRAPVRLLDTGSVKIYMNPAFKYQIYVPSPWRTEQVKSDGSDVKFTPGGESVEVTIEKNPSHLPLVNWYLAGHPEAKPADLTTFITKSNLDGIKGPGGRSAYIASDGSVYAIAYNLTEDDIINYGNTFEMMLNSFLRMK